MSAWLWLVARRLGAALIVLWVVASVVFVVAYAVPGDPARAMVGPHGDAATIERVRGQMCLDRPFVVQYGCFVGRLGRGDLGTSFRTGRPVAELLRERIGPTAELALGSMALTLLLSVPLALAAAARRGRPLDRATQIFAVVLQSTPPFVLGPLLVYLLAYRLGWFPVSGRGGPGVDRLLHLALPAATLAAAGVATYSRLLRGEIGDVLGQPFILAARARGAPPRVVWGRHVLRNAMGPLVALLGVDLGALFGGAAVTEYLFGWPGLGREAVLGILEIDLPVILGVVVVGSAAVIAANLMADIAHAALDPRLRPTRLGVRSHDA